MCFYASLLTRMVAGILWNQWPGSNGMGDRNGMESMAGIVWNMQMSRMYQIKSGIHWSMGNFNLMEEGWILALSADLTCR